MTRIDASHAFHHRPAPPPLPLYADYLAAQNRRTRAARAFPIAQPIVQPIQRPATPITSARITQPEPARDTPPNERLLPRLGEVLVSPPSPRAAATAVCGPAVREVIFQPGPVGRLLDVIV